MQQPFSQKRRDFPRIVLLLWITCLSCVSYRYPPVVRAFQCLDLPVVRCKRFRRRFALERWKRSPRFRRYIAHSLRQNDSGDPLPENLISAANTVDKGLNLLEISSRFLPQGILVTMVSEVWKFLWTRLMTELAPQSKDGAYVRPSYNFTFPPSSLESEAGGLVVDASNPETPRYRVYVGNPCPWCHRVLLTILVLQLQEDIDIVQLQDNPKKASRGGWILHPAPDAYGNRDLRDVYNCFYEGGSFMGRCTAPLLVDTQSRQIVSNESSDIVRLLIQFYKWKRAQQQLAVDKSKNSNDDGNDLVHVLPPLLDLLPSDLLSEIDTMNEWIYRLVNNGVYRCGFSTTQYGYDIACQDVREGLQRCEAQLQSTQAFMCGDNFTEVDVRLLPTILRFDGVYGPLFRAGGSHLRIKSDFPALQQWLVRCWTTIPGVRESIDLPDACASYYRQLFPLNPSGIVPFPVTAQELGLED